VVNDKAFDALIDAKLVRGGYVVSLCDLDARQIAVWQWKYLGECRIPYPVSAGTRLTIDELNRARAPLGFVVLTHFHLALHLKISRVDWANRFRVVLGP
jgi:hypothetical protein